MLKLRHCRLSVLRVLLGNQEWTNFLEWKDPGGLDDLESLDPRTSDGKILVWLRCNPHDEGFDALMMISSCIVE